MGINFDQIFGDAKSAVETGMNDILKLGGNAGLGYLEDQAIKIIQADRDQNKAAFETHAQEILKRPSSTDSFGAYVSNALESPLTKQYGGPILIAVCVIAAGAIFLSRGR